VAKVPQQEFAEASLNIERMPLQELQKAAAMQGWPTMRDKRRPELVARLKLWVAWSQYLTMADLLVEVEAAAPLPDSDPSMTEEEQRHHLLATLVVRLWCLPMYGSDGERVEWWLERIDDPVQAVAVVAAWETFEVMTLAELKRVYSELEFPVYAGIGREEILRNLKFTMQWNCWPGSALQSECAARGLIVELDLIPPHDRRDKMLEVLHCDICPLLFAAPLEDIVGSLATAVSIAERTAPLRREASLAELHNKAAEWDIFRLEEPENRENCLEQMHSVLKLANMKLHALERTCREWNVKLDLFDDLVQEQAARALQLYNLLYFGVNGVPIHRLTSVEAARRVASKAKELRRIDLQALKHEAVQSCFVTHGSFTKEHYIHQLETAYLWSELPLAALAEECTAQGIDLEELHSEAELDNDGLAPQGLYLDWISWVLVWQSFEVVYPSLPVDSVYSLTSAWQLQEELERFGRLPLSQLQAQYSEMGLPAHNMSQALLLERLRQVAVWLVMPLLPLQKLCRERGLVFDAADSKADLAWHLAWFQHYGRSYHHDQQRGTAPPHGHGPAPQRGAAAAAAAAAWNRTRTRTHTLPPRQRQQPQPTAPRPVGATRPIGGPSAARSAAGAASSVGGRQQQQQGVSNAWKQKAEAHLRALGLGSDATFEEATKAYRRLAVLTHPDKQQQQQQQRWQGRDEHQDSDVGSAFIRISNAYHALKDLFSCVEQQGGRSP